MTDGNGNVLEVGLEKDVPILRVPSDRSEMLVQALKEFGYTSELVRHSRGDLDLFGKEPRSTHTWAEILDTVRFPPETSLDDLQDLLDSLDLRSDQHIWRMVL